MKTTPQPETRQPSSRKMLMPILIAVCAASVGVGGTLWWAGNRAPATTQSRYLPLETPSSTRSADAIATNTTATNATATNATATNAVENALPNSPASADSGTTHQPPANLTAGLTPSQAALILGNWYYDHNQWTTAIVQYQKALGGGLDNADIRTDLGNCYRFSNQPQKALEQYQRAQKESPQHEQSLFNQGGLYAFSLKQPEKAIAAWRKYLQVFPNGQSVAEARQLIAQVQQTAATKP